MSSSAITPSGRNLFAREPSACPLLAGSSGIVQAMLDLGHLASNGGPTKTIALEKGSKAIDHAGMGAPDRDQRGRQRDAKPDIGAFER